jgi:hypothetical protein
VVLSTSAAPAGTHSPGTASRYKCGARAMMFYFWPQGHQLVPSVKFTAYPLPHMEAYTATGVFDAFVHSNGAMNVAKACKQVGNLPSKWASAKRKTIKTTMIVNCTFPAAAELNVTKTGAGGALTVNFGHTTKQVVQGSLKATGSSLTFDHVDGQRSVAVAEDGDPPCRNGDRGGRDRLQGCGRQRAGQGEPPADLHPRTAGPDEPERGPEQRQRHEHPRHRLAGGRHRHTGPALLART